MGLGGGGFSRFGRSSRLDDYVLSLAQKDHPRVLFLGTAGGDADSHIVLFYEAFSGRARPAHLKLFGSPSRMEWRPLIREQDVIYVGGGNVVSLLGVWRAHGLDEALRAAWERGAILCGVSAGSLCWFAEALTMFAGPPKPVAGLGFLPHSNCVHVDAEPRRLDAFRALFLLCQNNFFVIIHHPLMKEFLCLRMMMTQGR